MADWTPPELWVDGEVPNALKFNKNVKENLLYLKENIGSQFGKYRIYLPWLSGDGFTESIASGGAIDYNGLQVKLSTPSVSTGTVYLRSTGTFGSLFIANGKLLSAEFSFGGCSAITSQTVKLVLAASTTVPTADNDANIGFKIVNADLSAISASGGNNEATDTGVDISAGAALKRLRMDFTPGDNCKFYVDDILKATHITYLPAAGADLYLALMITNSASALKELTVYRFLAERAY